MVCISSYIYQFELKRGAYTSQSVAMGMEPQVRLATLDFSPSFGSSTELYQMAGLKQHRPTRRAGCSCLVRPRSSAIFAGPCMECLQSSGRKPRSLGLKKYLQQCTHGTPHLL